MVYTPMPSHQTKQEDVHQDRRWPVQNTRRRRFGVQRFFCRLCFVARSAMPHQSGCGYQRRYVALLQKTRHSNSFPQIPNMTLGTKVDAATGAASAKVDETTNAAKAEIHKEIVMDSEQPIGTRVRAAGDYIADKWNEMTASGEKELNKEELKH
ncbi:hypothetical protein CAOG_009425 [Capsaspora owczarzaki ATCC 30864]|uniref:Uncharacterized protein n=1 Tax=Capsaspora owczarzaki (strain ATCC 30864) TaxID=595528 RepID=A0A0D2X118_CAPO3|nr:hypothetical protein CAOG_009425 [Capsaspora owczarzaki ATCC 30864]